MCKHFDHNRAKLTKLIYSQKNPFDKEQIINQFSIKQHGDVVIDGSQTIADYLEELKEYGALIFESGRYRVKLLEKQR